MYARLSGWVALGLLVAGVASARADDDYLRRLRREIGERSRLLRDLRDGRTTDRYEDRYRDRYRDRNERDRKRERDHKRYGEGIERIKDPFGAAPDLRGVGSGFTPSRRTGRSRGTANPRDLNGQPLARIRTARATSRVASGADEKGGAAEPAGEGGEEEDADPPAIRSARLLVNNKEYAAARRQLLPIAASRLRPEEEVTGAKELLAEIDTLATKRVLEADELAAGGDTDQAAEIYTEVARSFGAAPAAKLAKSKLAVLRQDPEVAAEFLLTKARAYVDQKRPDVALRFLAEIAEKYGDTTSAEESAALAEKLKQAAAGETLTRAQVLAARKHLIIGNIHALNGRDDEAVASYRRVILEFEDTRFADTAREKIAKLQTEK
jgi:hypothetical protein